MCIFHRSKERHTHTVLAKKVLKTNACLLVNLDCIKPFLSCYSIIVLTFFSMIMVTFIIFSHKLFLNKYSPYFFLSLSLSLSRTHKCSRLCYHALAKDIIERMRVFINNIHLFTFRYKIQQHKPCLLSSSIPNTYI